MTQLTLLCRTATTFAPDKSIDDDAQAAFYQRLVDSGLGLYINSAGSGEGHALSRDELRRVYEIGVSVAAGKVQANANPPEQHTVGNTIAHAQIAVDAGVDVVNLYGPTSWHGFKPTDDELNYYFDEVLSAVSHPMALAPNPTIGYTPKASLIAAVCDRHPNVVAVNLAGLKGDNYFVQLKDSLTRDDVEIYVPYQSSLHTLGLGATGLLGAEANVIPKTFRAYIDRLEAKQPDDKQLADLYAQLVRFSTFVQPWHTASPRWIKMAMKAMNIPGAAGGVRDPYRLEDPKDQARFTERLSQLGIPEVDEALAVAS